MRIAPVCVARIFECTEQGGQLLSLAVFFIFGVAAFDLLEHADWRIALYAALSVTLVRMLSVALATAGMGFRASTRLHGLVRPTRAGVDNPCSGGGGGGA